MHSSFILRSGPFPKEWPTCGFDLVNSALTCVQVAAELCSTTLGWVWNRWEGWLSFITQTCPYNGQKPLWTIALSLGSSNSLQIHSSHLQWWRETEVFIFFSLNRTSQFSRFHQQHSGVGKRWVPAEVGGWHPYLTEESIYYRLVCFLLNHLQGVRPPRNCFICPCFRFSICNQKIMELYLFPTHFSGTSVQITWGWIGMWQPGLMRMGAKDKLRCIMNVWF